MKLCVILVPLSAVRKRDILKRDFTIRRSRHCIVPHHRGVMLTSLQEQVGDVAPCLVLISNLWSSRWDRRAMLHKPTDWFLMELGWLSVPSDYVSSNVNNSGRSWESWTLDEVIQICLHALWWDIRNHWALFLYEVKWCKFKHGTPNAPRKSTS